MAYKHKYVVGSTYAFYNNSDDLEDNANFASWSFDLVHADSYVTVISGLTTLTKDIISGSDYRWYATDFTFPQVDTGCYRFVVIDTADSDAVLYISDAFEVVNSSEGLTYVSYRNAKNILNYNYEVLTSFRNKAHMEVFNRKPLRPKVTEGYTLAEGNFLRVRTILKQSYEYVTGWFDENEHDAFQAMTIHSDFKLLLNGLLQNVRASEESEYSLEWQENYEYIEGSIRLEVDNRASSNEAV